MTGSPAQRSRAQLAARWLLLALLLALVLGAVLAAWLHGRDDSLRRVQRAGVLRVGYSVEPPFASLAANGAVVGQSAACAAEVARALGLRVEWVQTSLDRQIPDLLAGRFDVIGAGLFVSPERAAQVRFSAPTLRVRPAWLTRATSPAPTLAALREHGEVAVVSGSAAERHLAGLGLGQRLHLVPDARAGAAGLQLGQYDALALPWPAGRGLAAGRPGALAVWPADDGRPTREVALAFRPSDQALAAAADAALVPWLHSAAYRQLLAQLDLTSDDLPPAPGAAPR
jgi:polar amino acid transport system substrate-binding protein